MNNFAQKWFKIAAAKKKKFFKDFFYLFTPFNRFFAPTFQRTMSKLFMFLKSLGKKNGKKGCNKELKKGTKCALKRYELKNDPSPHLLPPLDKIPTEHILSQDGLPKDRTKTVLLWAFSSAHPHNGRPRATTR